MTSFMLRHVRNEIVGVINIISIIIIIINHLINGLG